MQILNSAIVQKYSKYFLPKLLEKATFKFNAYIRNRDEGKPCISCGKFVSLQAGHFYSGGHYSALRFSEDNVHGQCKRCNYFLSGDLNNYRKNLISRIGIKKVEELDNLAAYFKKHSYKWDRFFLINIIEKYK